MWEPEGILSVPSHISPLLCPKPSMGCSLTQGETEGSPHPLRGPHVFSGFIPCQPPHPSVFLGHTGLPAVPQTCQHVPTLGPLLPARTLSCHGICTTSSSLLPGLLGKDFLEDPIENSILFSSLRLYFLLTAYCCSMYPAWSHLCEYR